MLFPFHEDPSKSGSVEMHKPCSVKWMNSCEWGCAKDVRRNGCDLP